MKETLSLREALGKALCEIGTLHKKVVILSPDVGKSTKALEFNKKFPERYICTGISEQNTIGLAAGLAYMGWTPIVAGYAMFVGGKAWEPFRNSVCYPGLNVKIIATHGGINVGQDGVTHQCIEDIALMRAIPGLVVLAASSPEEVLPLLQLALSVKTPVYIRLEREASPNLTKIRESYHIGGSMRLNDGSDATIIAIGGMVRKALEAAAILEKDNINISVINMYSLKPLDTPAIIRAAKETGCIITAEDHNCHGGLGSAVAEILVLTNNVPMEMVAIKDTFAESGDPQDLFRKYHLTTADILSAVKKCLKRSGSNKRFTQ
jgi:transketolase